MKDAEFTVVSLPAVVVGITGLPFWHTVVTPCITKSEAVKFELSSFENLYTIKTNIVPTMTRMITQIQTTLLNGKEYIFETYESGGARKTNANDTDNVTTKNSIYGIRSAVINITVPKNFAPLINAM